MSYWALQEEEGVMGDIWQFLSKGWEWFLAVAFVTVQGQREPAKLLGVEQFRKADWWSLFARQPLQVSFFNPWEKKYIVSSPSRNGKGNITTYHSSEM